MAFIFYNSNPENNLVSDCVIRAISKVTGDDWETVYLGVSAVGLDMHDMPSSNRVWGKYLRTIGFDRFSIPNTCPDCYTIRDFSIDYNHGSYLAATGTHVVAVINGDYYDTFDSGDEVPIYFWRKEK